MADGWAVDRVSGRGICTHFHYCSVIIGQYDRVVNLQETVILSCKRGLDFLSRG